MDITIIGVSFNGDGTLVEVKNQAAALRQAGLVPLLENPGHRVVDSGDLALPVADCHRFDKNLPLWLHFDVDVIDPEWMPRSFLRLTI